MPSLNIAADALQNIIAQTGPLQGATYDPASGVFSYPDSVADAVNTANANLAAGLKLRLKAYAAGLRYSKEVAGTTVNGAAYPTDRESQSKYTAAAVMAQINPQASFNWKAANGAFVTLTAAQMIAVASGVGAYVQRCFDKESSVVAAIDAGTMTAIADIDAAFAVV